MIKAAAWKPQRSEIGAWRSETGVSYALPQLESLANLCNLLAAAAALSKPEL